MIDEDAIRERMRERAARGDYAGALSEYATLEVHPEATPSNETRRLMERIRRFAAPPLGSGRLRVEERPGDHTAAERAELHDGEVDAFESAHLGLSWEDHERRIVLLEDGRMIACTGLLVADITVGDATFPVVGVGGVIVTHTRRGQGIARAVMDAALVRAAQLGPAHALLFCRPDRAGFYAKLGFAPVRAPVEVGQPEGRRAAMPLDTMWRALRAGAAWPAGPVSVPGLPF